jgi:hypothetical protein
LGKIDKLFFLRKIVKIVGNIIKNIYRRFLPMNLKNFIKDLRKLSSFRKEIADLKREFLYFRIMHYFELSYSEEYRNEIEYLKNLGTLATYPYNKTNKGFNNVNYGFDRKKRMPFVVHKGKKLFFPKHFNTENAKQTYLNLVERENILGDGFIEKCPHQYTTESFFVKNNDIVLDVGACEGLFLLDVIDKVKKGYVFEPDKSWTKALAATFEPYKNRVTIVNKLASNKDSTNEIKIDTCLKDEFGDIFIKMDVEGYESLVLSGAKEVLNRKEDIRIACATYHKHDDASLFEVFFKGINYHTEFSDGYMLFALYDKIKPPFFRKGLIRARKIIV